MSYNLNVRFFAEKVAEKVVLLSVGINEPINNKFKECTGGTADGMVIESIAAGGYLFASDVSLNDILSRAAVTLDVTTDPPTVEITAAIKHLSMIIDSSNTIDPASEYDVGESVDILLKANGEESWHTGVVCSINKWANGSFTYNIFVDGTFDEGNMEHNVKKEELRIPPKTDDPGSDPSYTPEQEKSQTELCGNKKISAATLDKKMYDGASAAGFTAVQRNDNRLIIDHPLFKKPILGVKVALAAHAKLMAVAAPSPAAMTAPSPSVPTPLLRDRVPNDRFLSPDVKKEADALLRATGQRLDGHAVVTLNLAPVHDACAVLKKLHEERNPMSIKCLSKVVTAEVNQCRTAPKRSRDA